MATPMKVIWRDIEARHAAEEGSKDGVRHAAEEILEASNQIVPLDDAVLLGSGRTDWQPGAEATVYYDTPYAVKLHEDRHLIIRNGRRVQYLKKAVTSSRPYVLRWFGDAFKMRFARKVNW